MVKMISLRKIKGKEHRIRNPGQEGEIKGPMLNQKIKMKNMSANAERLMELLLQSTHTSKLNISMPSNSIKRLSQNQKAISLKKGNMSSN